jgi:RNA polymerase sigma-70 factor (ECF subfamily)
MMANSRMMKLAIFHKSRTDTRENVQRETYEAQIAQCWEALWRYAYRTTGNRDDAEDLLSETLVEGFRSFPQFRGDTRFVSWMYRIMTTTRIDMVRRARRRQAESLDTAFLSNGEEGSEAREIADTGSDPVAILIEPMLSEEVQDALDSLPEEFRAVVILVDIEQMDYADVSRVLDVPIGTVRSRLHRGRALLRRYLARYVER